MKTKLILSWMLLVILLCPASEGREKTQVQKTILKFLQPWTKFC